MILGLDEKDDELLLSFSCSDVSKKVTRFVQVPAGPSSSFRFAISSSLAGTADYGSSAKS